MSTKGKLSTATLNIQTNPNNHSILSTLNIKNNKSNFNFNNNIASSGSTQNIQNKYKNSSLSNFNNLNNTSNMQIINNIINTTKSSIPAFDDSRVLKNLDIPLKLKLNLKDQEEDFKKANDYDYQELKKFFDKKELIKKHRKKLLSPIKKQNKRWKNNLERYKVQKEQLHKELEEKLEKKILNRFEKAENVININKGSKLKDKEERIQQTKKSQEKVKESLKKYYKAVEDERKEIEDKVSKKLNNRAIRQEKNLEQIKKTFENLRLKSEERFNSNIKIINKENRNKLIEAENQKKEQFFHWYNAMWNNKKNINLLKNKHELARNKALNNQLYKEKKYEEQRLNTDIKLKEAELRRIKIKEENDNKIKKEMEKNNQLLENALQRKAELDHAVRDENKGVLYVQINKIKRPVDKDLSCDLNKSNNQ